MKEYNAFLENRKGMVIAVQDKDERGNLFYRYLPPEKSFHRSKIREVDRETLGIKSDDLPAFLGDSGTVASPEELRTKKGRCAEKKGPESPEENPSSEATVARVESLCREVEELEKEAPPSEPVVPVPEGEPSGNSPESPANPIIGTDQGDGSGPAAASPEPMFPAAPDVVPPKTKKPSKPSRGSKKPKPSKLSKVPKASKRKK